MAESEKAHRDDVGVLVKAMTLLVTLAEGSQSVVQLSKRTGISKPGVYRILKTLDKGGFVVKDSVRKEYNLGPAFIGLARSTHNSSGLIRAVRPTLREIHEKFNETVNLGVLNHGKVIYLDTIESRQRLRVTVPITTEDNAHATALGKAILSAMPRELALEVINESTLSKRTKNTLVSLEELIDATQKSHTLGYAIDNEEDEIGFRCVAAPILNSKGIPIGAISLTAPTSRWSLEDFAEIGEYLKKSTFDLRKTIPNL